MILVDTSVWIDFLHARETPGTVRLEFLLDEEIDIFTTGVIVQELLSGIKRKAEREHVYNDMTNFLFIMPTLETHVQAAEIYDACRKKGLKIRSGTDCLVAALALEYGLTLLQNDRDYLKIARVFSLELDEGYSAI